MKDPWKKAPDNQSPVISSAYAALLFAALRFTALLETELRFATLLTGPAGRALDRLVRVVFLGDRAGVSTFKALF